ncbi:hypothetical protein CABS01_16260 [Colletotrichum abscissum]|uniref:uncharacterized protein n=1 Tax=Colletotrichum abscissum TaxID=1671311 RepID=UPI0027D6E52A|nr:uncharacterized protein CABS01_16260 [Colletotrichum abscissum]KAK1472586.1 hypothetical protein CABS01_16260 [Colletotrichum abscissum]
MMALGVWGVCHEIWMWLMLPTLSGPAFCDSIVPTLGKHHLHRNFHSQIQSPPCLPSAPSVL